MNEISNKKEFPFYPKISDKGKQESQRLIDEFKGKLQKVADEVISNLYVDVPCYIESDSWSNFRNQIMDGFKNYDNRLNQKEFDFKEIRQQIFKDFKAEIIKDLNADLVKENEELRKDYQILRDNYQSILEQSK